MGPEIVLRRTLAGDGRSRAFINDQAVGVGLLKELGDSLLEVHGQQDDRGLFDTATHRALLDGFGGLNGDAQTVAMLHGDGVQITGSMLTAISRFIVPVLLSCVSRMCPVRQGDGHEVPGSEKGRAGVPSESIVEGVADMRF